VLERWTGKQRRGSFPQYFRMEGSELMAFRPTLCRGNRPKGGALSSRNSRTGPIRHRTKGTTCGTKPRVRRRGPFQATLTDGSVATYYWYPASSISRRCRTADLSEAEKARLAGHRGEDPRALDPKQGGHAAPDGRAPSPRSDPALIGQASARARGWVTFRSWSGSPPAPAQA